MLVSTAQNNTNYTNCNKRSNLAFKANPNSAKLAFEHKDFFVKMKGYGENQIWAKTIKKVADATVENIKNLTKSDEILPKLAEGAKEANFYTVSQRAKHTGILRTRRGGYGPTGQWADGIVETPVINAYEPYLDKFNEVAKYPLYCPYEDISLTRIQIRNGKTYMRHGYATRINSALDRVGKIFSGLKENYISKPETITSKNLPKINSDIAEIRWLMAHSTPWERGSDSISNVFMRALYKSMGIKCSPLKKGVSLDLEAFCTPLDEYKKNFKNYFEKAPKVVN